MNILTCRIRELPHCLYENVLGENATVGTLVMDTMFQLLGASVIAIILLLICLTALVGVVGLFSPEGE